MNYRMVIHTVGQVVLLEAAMLVLPLACALWYSFRDALCVAGTVTIRTPGSQIPAHRCQLMK